MEKQKNAFRAIALRIIHAKNQLPRSKTVACRRATHRQTHRQRKWKMRTTYFFFSQFFLIVCFSVGGPLKKQRKKEKSHIIWYILYIKGKGCHWIEQVLESHRIKKRKLLPNVRWYHNGTEIFLHIKN